jgi:uncharacterized protein (TIGR02646 family)
VIPIRKPTRAPAVLRDRGARATTQLCADYEADPPGYQSGQRTFSFDSAIYADPTVKNALRKAQRNKCAFCESRFDHVAFGDVEHFRPKAGFIQQEGEALSRPGYYWLAYDWRNLFVSCQLCNQRFKRNLFPLRDPSQRARCHRDPITAEGPLLIDPSRVDPGVFIGFKKEVAFAINDDPVGRATIEVLGLNRRELVDLRREHYRLMLLLRAARQELARSRPRNPVRRESRRQALARLDEQLAAFVGDEAEFAAMTRSALAEGGGT